MVAAAEHGGTAPPITDAGLLRMRDTASSIWWGPGWSEQQHTCIGLKFEGHLEWFIVACKVRQMG